MKTVISAVIAVLVFQMISLFIFLMQPMKANLSEMEGFNLSYIFNELGSPDYDMSAKDILGWQSHYYLIRQNIELRIRESDIEPSALPAAIVISNTLGKETRYFKYSKYSRRDKNKNFIRTTTITVWPYGDFSINGK